MRFSLNTPVRAEFVGTAFRLAEVVGSGIVRTTLGRNVADALAATLGKLAVVGPG